MIFYDVIVQGVDSLRDNNFRIQEELFEVFFVVPIRACLKQKKQRRFQSH